MAETYTWLGRYDEAATAVQRYLDRDPNNAAALGYLAKVHLITGRFLDAEHELEKALLATPGFDRARLSRGDLQVLRGDLAAAEREYLSMLARTAEPGRELPARVHLGFLCLTQGRLDQARDRVRASVAPGETNEWLGWVELDAGRADLAVRTFERLSADSTITANPRSSVYARAGLGLSLVATGEIVRAQQVLDDLRLFQEGVFVKAAQRMRLALSGALAARRGDGRAAVADLERSVSMLPHQFSVDLYGRPNRNTADWHAALLDLLAQAYTVAGDLTKARETYERITTLTTGRLAYGATYARSFYHLALLCHLLSGGFRWKLTK